MYISYLTQTRWPFHWRKQNFVSYFMTESSYFSRKQWFKVKNILIVDLFLTNMQLFFNKMLIDGLDSCELLVDYCDVFISCLNSNFWRHPFTAEYPMVSKWFEEVNFSKSISNKETNSSTSWMALRWVHFLFELNYSFNFKLFSNKSEATILKRTCYTQKPCLKGLYK